MSGVLESAVRRWTEAAALLARVGRGPAAGQAWLGPAWSGSAARAYEEWAGALGQASERAARALRAAADSARVFAGTWPERCLEADLDAVRAGTRAIADVPVPGERPARPPPPEPARPPARAPSSRSKPPRRKERPREPRRHAVPAPTHAPAGSVRDWIERATAILREHGYRPEQMDPDAIATIIKHESSGNPAAVNNWDSNAAKGIPSTGLMQTIPPTFERWHLPGHDQILDPVDNIIAGVRYAIARYGSVSRVPGVVSLAAGEGYRGY
ncbi:transglycosylase SLT domain-containing protein [Pseudonocardia acaciae]|uniref:transglycosylase SLT domain-containing protein n=1 Tax=Pseudonocardia acaciae TaxID=551276 RepID=UPI00247FA27C|nr:transglycosylase SLT domain-containing protein [Pseudonocardia acaciae]